jgi:hypothetical protein
MLLSSICEVAQMISSGRQGDESAVPNQIKSDPGKRHIFTRNQNSIALFTRRCLFC